MRRRVGVLLASCAAATALPALAQSSAETEVPSAFQVCVASYDRGVEESEARDPFGCTRAYFETLPGSEGSTLDMASAAQSAAETADLYIDTILLPYIFEQGPTTIEGDQPRVSQSLPRQMMINAYVRSARAAGETRCDLHYEANSEGTIRSVIAGSCAVENRDRLIEDLIDLYGGPEAQSGEAIADETMSGPAGKR